MMFNVLYVVRVLLAVCLLFFFCPNWVQVPVSCTLLMGKSMVGRHTCLGRGKMGCWQATR